MKADLEKKIGAPISATRDIKRSMNSNAILMLENIDGPLSHKRNGTLDNSSKRKYGTGFLAKYSEGEVV